VDISKDVSYENAKVLPVYNVVGGAVKTDDLNGKLFKAY
jgi:hypothetical protein